jgi:uncharacterized protein YcfL
MMILSGFCAVVVLILVLLITCGSSPGVPVVR